MTAVNGQVRGNMNDALKMQISAFVDGELPDNEAELLLRRLGQDGAMRQQVAEYMNIGRMIRRDQDVPGMQQLRGRVSAALGQEDVIVGTESAVSKHSSWLKPAGGFGVAAAVAVVAVMALGQRGVPTGDSVADSVAESVANGAVAIDLAPTYTEPTVEQVLANQPTRRLLEYSRRHDDSSADLGSNGILSRLVTLELPNDELVEIEPPSRSADEDGVPNDDAPQRQQ